MYPILFLLFLIKKAKAFLINWFVLFALFFIQDHCPDTYVFFSLLFG